MEDLLQLDAGSIVLALIVAAITVVVALILKTAWWAPTRASHLLQQQGVSVLPYRLPLLGNSLEIARLVKSAESSCLPQQDHSYLQRVFPFYTKYSTSHGQAFVHWEGRQPTMFLTNADDVKDVLSGSSKQYYNKSTSMPVLIDRIFGQSVASTEGEEWQLHRRIVIPAFFTDKIKGMVNYMLASTLEMADGWESLLDQAPRDGDGAQFVEVEVSGALKTLTADILARTCFGASYSQGKAAFDNQTALLRMTWKDGLWHLLIPGYRYFPTFTNRQCWKLQRSMAKNLKEIVEARAASVKQGLSKNYGEDLLGLVLASNDTNDATHQRHTNTERKPNSAKQLSISEVIDDCKAFFFAGHETTASLMTWTLMLLSEHKEWQDKARLEVLEVFGDRSQTITADHLGKLKVVTMILNETLRLYSPVPTLFARDQSTKGCKMGEKQLPNVALRLSVAPAILHRDPSLWGDDSELFNPQRFADGPSKACKHPNGFIPFGLGPHACIGQNFSITEARTILAVILQRFQLTPSPNYKHAPRTQLTLCAQYGVPIVLRRLAVE